MSTAKIASHCLIASSAPACGRSAIEPEIFALFAPPPQRVGVRWRRLALTRPLVPHPPAGHETALLTLPMKACPRSYAQARRRFFNARPRPRIPAANTAIEAGSGTGTAVVEDPTGVTSPSPSGYFWTGGGSYPVTKNAPIPAKPMLYTAPELVVMLVYSPDPEPTSKWDTAAWPELVW